MLREMSLEQMRKLYKDCDVSEVRQSSSRNWVQIVDYGPNGANLVFIVPKLQPLLRRTRFCFDPVHLFQDNHGELGRLLGIEFGAARVKVAFGRYDYYAPDEEEKADATAGAYFHVADNDPWTDYERLDMLVIASYNRTTEDAYEGQTFEYAKQHGAKRFLKKLKLNDPCMGRDFWILPVDQRTLELRKRWSREWRALVAAGEKGTVSIGVCRAENDF